MAGDGVVNGGTITTLNNGGTISGLAGELNSGRIGALDNSKGGVISGAQYGLENLGTIGSISNAGAISDPGLAIYSAGSIGSIANSGEVVGNVEIDNQPSLIVTGGTGKVFGVWAGGTITIGNGDLTFGGGNTALDENIVVNGGAGTVFNQDPISISASETITGNFDQTSTGELDFMVGGDMAGQYGALTVTGLTTLEGRLVLDLTNHFKFAAGDNFDFLTALGGVAGGFDGVSVDGVACGGGASDLWRCSSVGLNFSLGIGNGGISVGASSIPEPATWTTLVTGFIALGGFRLLGRKTASAA